MDHVYYFKDLFESIPDCRKLVLSMSLIKNDVDLLNDYRLLENGMDHLSL